MTISNFNGTAEDAYCWILCIESYFR